MFGMGFMEIFLILIVGIIALGPEKLPSAVVDIAKFFKKLKSGIDEAKSTIDSQMQISEIKQSAEDFKASIGDVKALADVDLDMLNNDNLLENKAKKIKKNKKAKQKKQNSKKQEKISLKETKSNV
jgi:sec-independent protein translocase protein TatB